MQEDSFTEMVDPDMFSLNCGVIPNTNNVVIVRSDDDRQELIDVELKGVDDVPERDIPADHEDGGLSVGLVLVRGSQKSLLAGDEEDLLHVRLGVGGEDGSVREVPDIDQVSLGQDQRLPINTQSCCRNLERK